MKIWKIKLKIYLKLKKDQNKAKTGIQILEKKVSRNLKKLELNTTELWNKYEFEEKPCKVLYYEKSAR